MGKNQLFLPGNQLDDWLRTGAVDIAHDVLVVRRTRERLLLEEALLVLAEVSEAGDRRRLVGRVQTPEAVRSLGGEVLGRSLTFSDAAYDIEPGFLVSPVGTPGQVRSGESVMAGLPRSDPKLAALDDETLLAEYLMQKLE